MPGIELFNGVINYGGVPSAGAGLLASRPAFGVAGRLYIGTDTNAWYRDTGTAWVTISAGVSGSAATGQATFWSSASTISGDNAFFWDNTNKRLGLGTATPGVRLDVHGTGVVQQLNGTGTANSYLDFQNAGSTQWRIGNFYNGAVQQFSIFNAAGTTNVLSILQSGFVGINVATPLYQLDVRTTNSISQNNYFQSTVALSNLWNDVTPGIELLNNITNSGSIGAGAGIKFNLSSTLNPQAGIFGIRESTTASSLSFYTQASNNNVLEKLRITGSGTVNIGSNFASTNNTLQVTGNVAIGYTSAAPTNGLIVAGNASFGVASSVEIFEVQKNQNANSRIQVTNTDATNSSSRATFRATSNNIIGTFTAINTLGVWAGSESNHDLILFTNATEKARLTATGNFGIGYTSNPTFAVNGSIYQGSNTANALYDMFCNGNLYSGGISPTILTVGTNTTMVRTATGYRCTATLTLTLPVASGLNNMYYVIANTGATVTVQRNGTDTIVDKTGASVTSVTVAAGTRSMFYVSGGTEIFQIF